MTKPREQELHELVKQEIEKLRLDKPTKKSPPPVKSQYQALKELADADADARKK